jgi:SulP family sulfate permease
MAGVILIVAYKLIDFHHITHILKHSKSETAILLVTFFATLFLELEFAIYMGVLLSLVIFLARTSTPAIITLASDTEPETGIRSLVNIQKKPLNQCPQLKIIRIDMSIYFGSLNHIQNRLHHIVENEKIRHILIVGNSINFIDISGAEMLISEAKRLERLGGGLYFAELKSSVYEFVSKNLLVKQIGNSHFFDKQKFAIKGIYQKLDQNICEKCEARVFKECI